MTDESRGFEISIICPKCQLYTESALWTDPYGLVIIRCKKCGAEKGVI